MKTLGQILIERRKALGISQKELAALILNRDGRGISATYLNYIEHDRGLPPDYLLDQFAEVLKVERDLLYFVAQRMPPDINPREADENQVTAAYKAFRRALDTKGGGKGGKNVGTGGGPPLGHMGARQIFSMADQCHARDCTEQHNNKHLDS